MLSSLTASLALLLALPSAFASNPITSYHPLGGVLRGPDFNDEYCLDTNVSNPGSPVQLWKCNSTPAQDFEIDCAGHDCSTGHFVIRKPGTNLCLDTYGVYGHQLYLFDCGNLDNPNQVWFHDSDNAQYKLVNWESQSNKPSSDTRICMDLQGASWNNGVPIDTWACHAGLEQKYSFNGHVGWINP